MGHCSSCVRAVSELLWRGPVGAAKQGPGRVSSITISHPGPSFLCFSLLAVAPPPCLPASNNKKILPYFQTSPPPFSFFFTQPKDTSRSQWWATSRPAACCRGRTCGTAWTSPPSRVPSSKTSTSPSPSPQTRRVRPISLSTHYFVDENGICRSNRHWLLKMHVPSAHTLIYSS